MSFRTMADAKKKASNTSASSLNIIPTYHNKFSQSIGNKQETEESILHNIPAFHGFDHDFQKISVHAPTENNLNNQAMQSCVVTSFPRAYPIGVACHICTAKIQDKLSVNEPGDQYEQEAERIAEKITGMSGPKVFRQTADSGTTQSSTVPPIVHEVLHSSGRPLDSETQAFFEPRFGYDFSKVRVYTDSKATESARSLNAKAYTLGQNIVFGSGQYQSTTEGKKLLAHELTHVVQQNGFVKQKYISRQSLSLSPAPTPSPTQQALNAITAFKARTSPQAFPNLNRSTVANDLQQRVANPSLINQSGLPVCGPAAFAYVWATRDIVAYVNFAISLFENGQGRLGSLDIAPDNDLKSRSPGSYTWQAGLKPAEADWMVLSSIRDAENVAIDFEGGPSETTAGGTGEGDIIKWLRELGFKKVKDDVDRVFGDTVDDARAVNNSVGPGNYILLCVDAHMIDQTMKKSGKANHWVVLVGSFTFSQGKVTFRCWTWGRFYDVSVTEAKFNDTYYGAIIAFK